jgi:hypothetical protein
LAEHPCAGDSQEKDYPTTAELKALAHGFEMEQFRSH